MTRYSYMSRPTANFEFHSRTETRAACNLCGWRGFWRSKTEAAEQDMQRHQDKWHPGEPVWPE